MCEPQWPKRLEKRGPVSLLALGMEVVYRVTELFRLEKTLKIIESNC